jgi:hypothetical protein
MNQSMANKKMELGAVVRDTISGFQGVAVCRAEWLNGCKRVTIQPQKLKEGSTIPCETFDEDQIEVIKESDRSKYQNNTGGPYPEPVRR